MYDRYILYNCTKIIKYHYEKYTYGLLAAFIIVLLNSCSCSREEKKDKETETTVECDSMSIATVDEHDADATEVKSIVRRPKKSRKAIVPPVINIKSDSIKCNYAEGLFGVDYVIENPLVGLDLNVSEDVDWIENLVKTDNKIMFEVRENNDGGTRSGKIVLSYGYLVKEIYVEQTYEPSQIEFAAANLICDYQRVEYGFEYNIRNPRAGEEINAATQSEWVTDVVAKDNRVSFTILENEHLNSRDGKITVSYGGIRNEYLIHQKGNLSNAKNLSANGTSNCYIVSESGKHKFALVKGNSNISVEPVKEVDVLWESFGTESVPNVGELIHEVAYVDDCIFFNTSDEFKEGNAVIAAKDYLGNILWSWHIWLTDMPDNQEYLNEAGIMMDRNLGATSTNNNEMETLGLLYQWGRKDPFLGVASATIQWPEPVISDKTRGTIDFATENPTTFIIQNDKNDDWFYSEDNSVDNARWGSSKTIFDPCPVGYRVPDGGSLGIWATAFESTSYLEDQNKKLVNGIEMGQVGKYSITEDKNCWYPLPGYIGGESGKMMDEGKYGNYWSCTPKKNNAYALFLYHTGTIAPMVDDSRATAHSVRCVKDKSTYRRGLD